MLRRVRSTKEIQQEFGTSRRFHLAEIKIVTCGGVVLLLLTILQWGKGNTYYCKVPHPYEYVHDEMGLYFRMPNLNAALACAQLRTVRWF
jgi:dTDP-4-amino-4,6-dideoxygalactose transaminase